MDFLDIHIHKHIQKFGVTSIQSFTLTDNIYLDIPKTRPASVGLHPWYATLDNLELQMKYLNKFATQTNVKLIGECGLDKLRGETIEKQIIILEAQIKLAEKLQKPLILHCVKAFDELIAIKQRLAVKVPMIIHGFNKNEELGKQLLSKGFLLSFGASRLNGNSSVTKFINEMDNFFLETDDAETSIEDIYHTVANLKNCTVNELKARIFASWKKLIPNP